MKALMPILIGLLVVGCGEKEASLVSTSYTSGYLESHFLGSYENNQNKNWIHRLTLKENGRYFAYINDVKYDEGNWKVVRGENSKGEWTIKNSEIHYGDKYFWAIFVLNANHDLVHIANGSDTLREPRTRENVPKDEQEIYNKIKLKTIKALKEEDVVGAYTQKYKNEEGAEFTRKLIFLKNGVAKGLTDDVAEDIVKWKIDGSEIKTIRSDEWTGYIYKKDKNGDLSEVGAYQGAHVMPHTMKERNTWDKIK